MRPRQPALSVSRLQRRLEEIYSLEALPRVEEYLVTSQELRQINTTETGVHPQVLVQEKGEELLLAVHIGDRTLHRVERLGLERTRLSDFLKVAEEVSHFLYLVWNARHERSVSLLDVEFQGEIDKFLLASEFYEGNQDLYSRLFERVSYERRLSGEGLERYQEANRLGGKYCRRLSERFEVGGERYRALQDLRAFYRLTSGRRLSHAERS